MVSLRNLLVHSLLAATATASSLLKRQYLGPGRITGDTGVHDPTVVKTPSGSYILAHMGDNISLKTSADRTAWRNTGAGSTFGSSRSAILLATSTTGASGSWANQGLVIESTTSSGWNAIDPNLIVDAQGKWWLSFGSFWSGLKMIPLDPATGKRTGSNLTSIDSRPNNGGAVEALFITRRGNFYYLWVSFDKCSSGAASTYRIMVGRSTSVTGPFVDRNGVQMMNGGGTQAMASHGSIHGPGHNSVSTDADAAVLVYHYYADNGQSLLGINLIRYDNDWLVIY
ncbi:arabinan endo-1,5-alpha-L-arabinosidase A [Microdochium bolleyi]|uniref:arabinan endo-1,5-alpha-L-arabinosidase n=1 Tax=Microdochium bolleyi TaxID=196109 RepID=A0A136IJG0_9PEZI|nr:arabinan endo-1,5-alpha-L-arabinosidase A [Microdochium bolleyi]